MTETSIHKYAGASREDTEERMLNKLLSTIQNSITSFQHEIDAYSNMNNILTGSRPEKVSEETPKVAPNGLVGRLLESGEGLLDLCQRLEEQNNRLGAVVSYEET